MLKRATFQPTISPHKSLTQDIFSGLGRPVAQGALELDCSFLQLEHNRTSLFWCDRKELRLLHCTFCWIWPGRKSRTWRLPGPVLWKGSHLIDLNLLSFVIGHFYRKSFRTYDQFIVDYWGHRFFAEVGWLIISAQILAANILVFLPFKTSFTVYKRMGLIDTFYLVLIWNLL